ncbi:hypothetical protein ACFLTJ_02005 [Chloroflexota bacterium]
MAVHSVHHGHTSLSVVPAIFQYSYYNVYSAGQSKALVINIPPAQQVTPTWIYAIIGIGAALAVVVIVLIVRTRRP